MTIYYSPITNQIWLVVKMKTFWLTYHERNGKEFVAELTTPPKRYGFTKIGNI